MKKEKVYSETRFSAEVLKETIRTVRDIGVATKAGNLMEILTVQRGDTKWTFGTEDEFITEYRSSDGAVSCHLTSGLKFNFVLSIHSRQTRVEFRCDNRGDIEKIFDLFDAAASSSILPPPVDSDWPSFRTRSKVPSLLVSKDLIQQLKQYVVQAAKQFAAESFIPDSIERATSVSISDSQGSESFVGSNELPSGKFADDTRFVELKFPTAGSKFKSNSFSIDIKLSAARWESTIEVACRSPQAREIASGVVTKIRQIVEPFRTKRDWMQSGPGVVAGSFIVSVALIVAVLTARLSSDVMKFTAAFISLSGIFYAIGLPLLRPATEFDSRRAERRSFWFNWFVGGCATFIFFGIVAVFCRDWIAAHLR